MVSLEQVHKSYGETPVVKGLSLEVARGEMIALLGPSGCGKTTTLRIIAGLEHADAGRVHIDGALVTGQPPEARGLGMVFQSYAIWPHKTVAENVEYPLKLKGVAGREALVRQALGWVRLDALAQRMPHALSGGQLQRVALARALVASPKVLLLDEPLSNLDAALREDLRAEIAALRARLGTTMIYVTHDQNEALALADRVAVMNHGVIEQLAPPRELYESPKTPFVAAFVGGANVLEGRLDGADFVCGDRRLVLPADLERPAAARHLVIRPEALTVGDGPNELGVVASLFLGHSTEVRFDVAGHLMRALAPAHVRPKPGENVRVRIDRAQLFS
ncbi:MAG: ABC transporter ATP-binding protein [Myxococcaceae bacterium]|nr:ABC transporter ATP-binding protein [Myxococcaceae bacterium]